MSDLHRLLCDWKLENVLPHLIAEEIDVDVLTIMKLSHIKDLLNGFPLGIQIRFQHNLEQWRYQIGQPLKDDAYYERKETPDEDVMKVQSKRNSNKDTQQDMACPINLKNILLANKPEGPDLLDIYSKNQQFSNPERSHLIDLIVIYYLRYDLPFDLHKSYDLENAILSLFPSEKLNFYRNAKQGKIYAKYLSAKAVYSYNNKESGEMSTANSTIENDLISKIPTFEAPSPEHEHSQLSIEEKNVVNNLPLSPAMPTEILVQTLYDNCKMFVRILEPFLFKDFLSSACSLFNIRNSPNILAMTNDCEICPDDFKNIILQHYKLPTFCVELKERVVETKLTQVENSCSQSDFSKQTNTCPPQKSFNPNVINCNNTSEKILANHLPDANYIRNIPSLLHIVKISDTGRPLENKHRTKIAKALIDECLNFQPERVLKRQDFFTLTDNLIGAFPNEIASSYFIPSQPNHPSCGKLWNAYNNKRSFLSKTGIVQRRHHGTGKRKLPSDDGDEGSEKTNDKIYVTENLIESKEFSISSSLNWDNLQVKWSDCYKERRTELLIQKMPPHRYMEKYSILKSNRGIDLMEIDVNILHPTVVTVNNWLSLYEKVIEMGRKVTKLDHISGVLEIIDSSNDEKYRASLALLIIPYIFPYNARRNELNEKASRYEIQQRFIKEYASLDDLNGDSECYDFQIRFVHQNRQINYAEFKICGHLFKSVDLLEALSSMFHYTIGMNMEYPKICLHIWQFVQLAIFQIEIQGGKQPNVESTVNDLYML